MASHRSPFLLVLLSIASLFSTNSLSVIYLCNKRTRACAHKFMYKVSWQNHQGFAVVKRFESDPCCLKLWACVYFDEVTACHSRVVWQKSVGGYAVMDNIETVMMM